LLSTFLKTDVFVTTVDITNESDRDNFFESKPAAVVEREEFPVAAVALDHDHIHGQCTGLIEAGAELRFVHDPYPEKVAAFVKTFPQAKPVDRLETILDDPAIRLVAAAAVPSERIPLGLRVMEAGKDYFTDKTPFTSLDQLEAARAAVARTGRKYLVYFCERLHNESTVLAGRLIEEGHIGRVINVLGLGPHRLNARFRPSWFFEKARYGGILCDNGSHQIEQFLFYAGAREARTLMRQSLITTIRTIPSWKIMVMPILSPITEQRTISVLIGLPRIVCGLGAMGGPSSWERRDISSCGNTLMSRGIRAATSFFSSTQKEKKTSPPQEGRISFLRPAYSGLPEPD
jgi:hypothetical protein